MMWVMPLALALALVSPIESLDHAIQHWAQESRTPALEGTMHAATQVGTPVVVLGGLLAIALIDPAEGVPLARVALLALAPTNLAVEGIKRLTRRTRPDGEHKGSNSSFPSSHSANAFALAAILSRRWRRAALPLWLAAALIAASRVYLNRHFASDMLVGLLIGIGCAVWAMRRMHWPSPGAAGSASGGAGAPSAGAPPGD